MQPKGELVGPGKFVNQDTLVANTQGSSSLMVQLWSRRVVVRRDETNRI